MSTVPTEALRFPADDQEIGGELVCTPGDPCGRLVLLPDVHGISDLYRRIAGRFAEAGFLTLILDLYVRQGRPNLRDPEAVSRWIAGLDDRRVLGDVQAAVAFLAESASRDAARPVALTGFCIGGQYALMAACKIDGLAACVSFYGMLRTPSRTPLKLESPLELAPGLRCPFLGLFGAEDPLIPLDDVKELEQLLEEHCKRHEIEIFPEAGHAFLNDTRPEAYRPDAAERAFLHALRFLRETHV